MRRWLEDWGCIAGLYALGAIYLYLFMRRALQLDLEEWRRIGSIGKRHLLYQAVVLAAVILCVAVLIAAQVLASRWRRIKVFIAYQHRWEDIAAEIQSALSGRWLMAVFLPFDENADHDDVIDAARRQVQWSDLVVVLPGPDAAWVDHEIAIASGLTKPVILVRASDDVTTPNVALRGYPVCDLAKLRAAGFRPLANFILYVTRFWRDTMRNFLRVSAGFWSVLAAVLILYWITLGFIGSAIADLMRLFEPRWALYVDLTVSWIYVALSSIVFAASYVMTVADRLKCIAVARQKILTRDYSFEILSECLGSLKVDRQILECLEKEPLPLRY